MEKADTEFMKLMGTKQELHPDLQRYIEDGPFGLMLKHPLVFSVMHNAQLNAFVNAQYEQKKEALNRAYGKNKWHSFVFLHEALSSRGVYDDQRNA